MNKTSTTDQTIEDFGDQWTRYMQNDGYYASQDMFADICGPLIKTDEIQGLHVADIGSGTGRIVSMLLNAGASKVTAIEPSDAFNVLVNNLKDYSSQVKCVRAKAENLPDESYDLVVSFGVLHHIPDPAPVVHRAYYCLKPGGKFLIWLYGTEGNETYLRFAKPIRTLTQRLPDALLVVLSHTLTAFLSVYVWACKFFPLPMRKYMRSIIAKYSWKHRFLTVFDQLNPSYAKYYTKDEAYALLHNAGFHDVQLYHRHGYSWTVIGYKPKVE